MDDDGVIVLDEGGDCGEEGDDEASISDITTSTGSSRSSGSVKPCGAPNKDAQLWTHSIRSKSSLMTHTRSFIYSLLPCAMCYSPEHENGCKSWTCKYCEKTNQQWQADKLARHLLRCDTVRSPSCTHLKARVW